MIIREARISDYAQLREIYMHSRQESFHWANAGEMALEDFDRDTSEEEILVAESGDQILGFASLYVPDRFVHNLFVHPKAAGKGAGKQLLQQSIARLGTPVTLKCVSDNHKALSFYKKQGWKTVVEEGDPGARYWVLVYE
ncbi:N-acetyltransferase family protein [Paenibacillus sp. 2TAF8]|jgi:GNAT superfamily N-acetyltransferase|uniref:GNAT family N-acetyltransferase n=1 Tax=Paenibacillus sp. 2TAF8 TaxID=3233020 RepID=UPI003F9930F1